MAVYLGGSKVKVNLNNKKYNLKLLNNKPKSVTLSSYTNNTTNKILKDVNNIYLKVKEC